MQLMCQHCHSPRLIRELAANGERMAELGKMKLREAAWIVASAKKEFPADRTVDIEALYKTMQEKTFQALTLGIAHQSPDYQWWHGHPALDGKLLRIKGELTRLRRVSK